MSKLVSVLGLYLVSIGCFAQMRIITAGSAMTETVCAVGDCDKIVAADKTSLFPASIQNLPSIGYRGGISAEGIINLKPTLIIAEKDYVKDEVLRQLESTGIQLLIIDREYTVEDTKKFIRQIATKLSRQKEGEAVISKIEADIKEAKELVSKAGKHPSVLCIYNRGTATVSVAGEGTFGDIIKYTGAVPATASIKGFKPLNTEALIASNPDYIVLASSGYESIGGMEGVLKIPGIAQTTAGKKKQIVSIESMMLTNFGPRLGAAIKELVTSIYPEVK